MMETVSESPGGLVGTGNDSGSVPELVAEISATLDAPDVAAIAAGAAYGEGAVPMGMATEGGGGEADDPEAGLDALIRAGCHAPTRVSDRMGRVRTACTLGVRVRA